MSHEPENMVKGAIGEIIVEEMFKELGFFVMRLGKEHTVNPLTQLQEFVKSCNGKFSLEKLNDEIKEVTHVNVLPDFVIVHPNGKVSLLEVKYRWNGIIGNHDNLLFQTYPEAHMLIVNLKVDENVIEILDEEDKKGFENELKNSRFHIWFKEDCTKDDEQISVLSLKDWLDIEFKIKSDEMIQKYERLAEKWLRKEDLFQK